MFGLPPWAISLIIQFLQKVGAVNWAEAMIGKAIVSAEQHIKNLKTYSSSDDFPRQDSKGQANFNQ